MLEGFRPPPPDATHGVRRAEVPTDVRAYADNLMLQLDEIVARYGFRDFRDARETPDGQRHARLEAVMELDDLDRYRELIVGYRDAVRNKRIPTADLGWRGAEFANPFAYDREKVRELGFVELEIGGHAKAREFVDAIRAKDPSFMRAVGGFGVELNQLAIEKFWRENRDELPDIPAVSSSFFLRIAQNQLSDTIDGDKGSAMTGPTRPHMLLFGQPRFLLVMDWKEFNPEDEAEKAAAVSPQTKALLRRLFGQEDVANISRATINEGLFSDHDARVPTARAVEVIRDLIGPRQLPARYELRLMRYDEYARAAWPQRYGRKNLSTWFDGYVALGSGHRNGLLGGNRREGGAANVDSEQRGSQRGNLAVRLVLSRKA